MRFSVITPSFRNSELLKQCVASVADQGVELEHIIQDACSDDGTREWLSKDPRVKAFFEKDRGMYDAVNKGLLRSTGEILSYINCDEQYLPGSLKSVDDFFQKNPQVDMVFGDFVVVDGTGDYIFHRKVMTPLLYHTWVDHLQTFTCATFFRRSLIDQHRLLFNPDYKMSGDGEWMLRVLQKKLRMAVMRRFTSTFMMTGTNLGASPRATEESQRIFKSAPAAAKMLKPLIILQHRLRRLLGGIYWQKPFSYELFTSRSLEKRERKEALHPRFRWQS